MQAYQPQRPYASNFNNRIPEEEPKKLATRRTVDYGSGLTQFLTRRKLAQPFPIVRNEVNDILNLLPPSTYASNPASALCVKYIHTSSNKNKHPINALKWTPDGRRVLTASSSGEFTLWNGLTFNFETILQAHESAVRAIEWSPNGEFLVSGDHEGVIKYAQPNMNIVKAFNAHTEAVRDIAFSPGSNKFITASDDGSMKAWNFNEGIEERSFIGHGWDVKSVDWHPTKGLIVSGSKDNLVKLWDPRTAKCLSTLHGHKNTVSKVMFQRTGGAGLLATCSRDSSARVVELRMMRDLRVLRGHEKDVTTLTWHPVVPSLLSTGSHDGVVNHYLLNESAQNSTNSISSLATLAQPTVKIQYAHESAIWAMEYHPLGHLLVTGSNDRATRFWARARPDDEGTFLDRYHTGDDSKEIVKKKTRPDGDDEEGGLVDQQQNGQAPTIPVLPGLGGQAPPIVPMSVPGLSGGIPGFGAMGVPPPWQGMPGMNGLMPPPPPGQFPMPIPGMQNPQMQYLQR